MQETPPITNKKLGQVTIASFWTLSSNLVDKLIGFISIAILARLLTPADFGLVAMAGSLVAIAELFNAFGFDWALVRLSEPKPSHYNCAWTLRVLFGLATTIFLLISAPIAAYYLNQKALWPIISVLGCSFIIGAFENIGIVDFRRNFLFNKEFILRFWPKVIGCVVATLIAFFYHSYWALVLGTLTLRLSGTLISYLMHAFRPWFSLKQASELFSFSSWLFVSNIVLVLRNSFTNLFIGRFYGAGANGMYSLAYEIANLSITELVAPINRAVFTKYTQNTNQIHKLQEGFLTTASIIWMIALPASLGIFSVASEIVAFLLGQQWKEATPILKILALGGGFSVMVANTQYIFLALGLSNIVFFINTCILIMMIGLTVLLTHFIGLIGVAYAYVLAIFFAIPLNYYLLWKLVKINFFHFLKNVWRIFVASIAMVIFLKLLFLDTNYSSSLQAIGPLTLKMASGFSLYLIILLSLWFLSGKPKGPEQFAIKLFKNYWPGTRR